MLAAECAEHFDYSIGITHMNVVMQVADRLRKDQKPQGVAVVYDRLARYVVLTVVVVLLVITLC